MYAGVSGRKIMAYTPEIGTTDDGFIHARPHNGSRRRKSFYEPHDGLERSSKSPSGAVLRDEKSTNGAYTYYQKYKTLEFKMRLVLRQFCYVRLLGA